MEGKATGHHQCSLEVAVAGEQGNADAEPGESRQHISLRIPASAGSAAFDPTGLLACRASEFDSSRISS